MTLWVILTHHTPSVKAPMTAHSKCARAVSDGYIMRVDVSFWMLASVLQPLAILLQKKRERGSKIAANIAATLAAFISITSAISQQPRLRY